MLKKAGAAATAVLLFHCLPFSPALAEVPAGTGALGCLQGVHLSLEGPDRADLERDLAKILLNRGIRLLSEAELGPAPGEPVLKIRVATCGPRQGVVAYTVMVDLYQTVFLAGTPDLAARAATWSSQATGFASPDRPGELRQPMADLIGLFAGDYLQAHRDEDARAARTGAPPRQATTVESTAVFSGPGSIFDLLGTLPKGSGVRLLEEQSGWVRIGTDRIPFGWVHADFVRGPKDPPGAGKPLP